jgi:peptidoglycan hydrolase CwlO-like protein
MNNFEKFMYTILGTMIGALPKLYEIFVQKGAGKDAQIANMLTQLSEENQAIRKELREENNTLREQVASLYDEIGKVRDENFSLKRRINELEIELETLRGRKHG